ncbi:hypothetical protein ABZ297_10680 [Nonomuraea sp. NPDC005983]|uniref:hypothetical protein n=1 Tax=Nonomuraea sp. NPDC005983 TaxID=3155595 RepID=UPI0033A8C07F
MDEFRSRRGSFLSFTATFVPPLVLFFPVCLLLGALLTQSSIAGLLIAVAATAALGAVLVVGGARRLG